MLLPPALSSRMPMKAERLFYTAAGVVFLALTLAGFHRYIFGRVHFDGSPIDPTILAIVVAHSTAIFAWYVLFFTQSLLISLKNRRLHMKLGWSVVVIATTIAVTAPLVAIRSVRLTPDAVVFTWPGHPFLLIMFSEIALYVTFVAIGVIYRKQPRIHRPMMILASLILLTGATGRIPLVNSIFGFSGWTALFGPVVALGALLLLIRSAMTRSFDRPLAAGLAALTAVTLVVPRLALTGTWSNWAVLILQR